MKNLPGDRWAEKEPPVRPVRWGVEGIIATQEDAMTSTHITAAPVDAAITAEVLALIEAREWTLDEAAAAFSLAGQLPAKLAGESAWTVTDLAAIADGASSDADGRSETLIRLVRVVSLRSDYTLSPADAAAAFNLNDGQLTDYTCEWINARRDRDRVVRRRTDATAHLTDLDG